MSIIVDVVDVYDGVTYRLFSPCSLLVTPGQNSERITFDGIYPVFGLSRTGRTIILCRLCLGESAVVLNALRWSFKAFDS